MNKEDRFADILREHQAMVFRTLARLTGTREHLEDLAQEVFLRLYRGLRHFRGESKLSTYLYRIILNVAQDERERRRRETDTTHSLTDPDQKWEDRLAHIGTSTETIVVKEEAWILVERSLAELSEPERTTLVLYHQEECSYEEIAKVLNVPIGTVRTHLHRGREKLRLLVQRKLNPGSHI